MIQWTTSVIPNTSYHRSAYYSDSGPAGPGGQATISYSFSSFGTTGANWSETQFAEANITGGGAQGRTVLGNINSVIFFTKLNNNTPPNTITTGTSSTLLSTVNAQTSITITESFQPDTTFTTSWARFVPTINTFSNNGQTSGEINFVSIMSTRLTSGKGQSSSRTKKTTVTANSTIPATASTTTGPAETDTGSTTINSTHIGNVLAATIYEAEEGEVIFAADASIASEIYSGAAHNVASTFTRITVMPVTDTYAVTVIDLSPVTDTNNTSSQAPAISTYSSVDVDVTKTYERFTYAGTISSSAIDVFFAIPQITRSYLVNQFATETATSSKRVFPSFSNEISYTSSEQTQTGTSLFTVSTFLSNSVMSTVYEDLVTRTINGQATFVTSLSSTLLETLPYDGFDYGRTVSFGENITIISENINAAALTKPFSPQRTIKKAKGARTPQDSVAGFYGVQGIGASTFYPDFDGGLPIYPFASRSVHTVFPRTYKYYTDEFDEAEAGTISIEGLNGSGTNQFGTFRFSIIPIGDASITNVFPQDSVGIGVAVLGKYETAYQEIPAGVYSKFNTTTRYESPQFMSFAGQQSAAPEKLIPITGFTTAGGSENAYSIIWSEKRNSVDLPPDTP